MAGVAMSASSNKSLSTFFMTHVVKGTDVLVQQVVEQGDRSARVQAVEGNDGRVQPRTMKQMVVVLAPQVVENIAEGCSIKVTGVVH